MHGDRFPFLSFFPPAVSAALPKSLGPVWAQTEKVVMETVAK